LTVGIDCPTASITSEPSAFGSDASQNPVTGAVGASFARSDELTVIGSSPVACCAMTVSLCCPDTIVSGDPSSSLSMIIVDRSNNAVPGLSLRAASGLWMTDPAAAGSMPVTWTSWPPDFTVTWLIGTTWVMPLMSRSCCWALAGIFSLYVVTIRSTGY
jgi:hypothetical protein